ncbi:MAG: hypothetical protein HYS87_00465 [Candidatus Colwellbacteria bacterium]|nr:hypothetical protein [Candidatus Colwellbacteria bacterium]
MKRLNFVRFIVFSAALTLLSQVAQLARADHEGPERIVEGKYAIYLSIIPEGSDYLNLRFFFNDAKTGKRVSDIIPTVSISDEGGAAILSNQSLGVKNGVAELKYAFPHSGLFNVYLSFGVGGEPEKVYSPELWSIWVPGADGVGAQGKYPVGLSEISGFALAALALVLVIWSFISNRNRK